MMKYIYILSVGLILITISCNAQDEEKLTYKDFDVQILDYQPKKNDVPENSFQDAVKFLAETQNRIKKNKRADVSDYWNIITIFSNLNESNDNIDIAIKKFMGEESSCEYLISFENYFERYNEYIRFKLTQQLEICKMDTQSKNDESIDIEKYVKTNGLNKNLIETIYQIGVDDQKNRDNEKLQNELDIKNRRKIDSLYSKHKIYIGKTLVGNDFKNVMWQVIQHSNLEYMERYLPIVISAVEKDELGQGALKYLIDRIYAEKYNYQIFGSQGNIRMANDKIRKDVKMKYGIE